MFEKEIEFEMGTRLIATPLPLVYQLEEDRPLASTSWYKKGKLFGIDLASAFAVHALSLSNGMHVLDLCCAPGAKLCMIAEETVDQSSNTGEEKRSGTVTGVDVARQRLNTCRNLIRKYKLMGIRLYHADGTSFDVGASIEPIRHNRIVSVQGDSILDDRNNSKKRKRSKKVTETRARSLLRRESNGASSEKLNNENDSGREKASTSASLASALTSPLPSFTNKKLLYDRVLVDAECTHDGSLKHMLRYQQTNWKDFEEKVLVPDRLKTLERLQRNLLANGFRLLKPGGILV